MFFFFDPMYFIILAPAMLLAGWAQMKVKSAYAKAQKFRPSSGMSGAEAAQRILRANDVVGVTIEQTHGFLGDHYDPRSKTLRLSEGVFEGRNLAAVGIAAHEAGHAIQDARSYAPLRMRNAIVPMASTGTRFSFGIFIVGMFTASNRVDVQGDIIWGMGQYLMFGAILLFSLFVIFQLINLPVEYDASRRARVVLVDNGIIAAAEEPQVAKVLNAAALTYVAATLSAILTLAFWVMRSGLLGGRRS